jgi:LytS/YehU family sensor histidine kinase
MTKTQQERKKKFEQVEANERLEGLEVSKDTKKIVGNYISEKASLKEVAKQIRSRYGVK